MLLKKFAAKSQGKEPIKFSFNISINSLDDFKKSKTSQGSTYVVHWKRGNKNSGKTEPKAFNDASGKVVWMDTFKFNGTLFRELKNKDQYKKKALNFVLEECPADTKKKSITIAKAEIDISKYAPVSSELEHGTHEKTETVLVDLGIKGNPEAKIKVNLNIVARSGIKPGDEAATLMSEYTGVDTEVGDDNSEKEDVHTGKETATEPKSIEDKENEKSDFEVSNDEKTHDQDDADEKTHDEDHAPASSSSSSAPIASSSAHLNASFAVSKEDENKKLREAVVELQKQLKEAKQIKDANKKEKKDLLQKIQKERDDANSRVKQLEKELQTSKIELEHLQSANTNQNNKFFEDQLKYQKEKTELEQKLKNLNKELDDIQQRNFELEDEKDTLIAEKEELIEKIKSVEGNAEVNGGEAKKIKTELDALKEQLESQKVSYEEQIAELKEERGKLESTVQEQQSSLQFLYDHKEKLWSSIEMLQETQAQLQQLLMDSQTALGITSHADFDKLLKDSKAFKDSLKQLDVLKAEYSELKARYDVIDDRKMQSIVEIIKLEEELAPSYDVVSLKEQFEALKEAIVQKLVSISNERNKVDDVISHQKSKEEALIAEIESLKENRSKLEKEKDALFVEIDNDNKELVSKLNILQMEKEAEKTKLLSEIVEQNNKIHQLETSLADVHRDVEHYKIQKELLTLSMTEKENIIAKLQDSLINAENEQLKLLDQINELKHAKSEVESNLQVAKSRVEELISSNESLQKLREQSEANLREYKSIIESYKEPMSSLEKQITEQTEIIDKLKIDLSAAQNTISELGSEKSEEAQNMSKTVAEKQALIETYKAQIENLEEQISDVKSALESSKSTVDCLNVAFKQKEIEIEDLNLKISSLEDIVSKQEKQIEQYHTEKKVQMEKSIAEAASNSLENKLDVLKKKVEASDESISTFIKEEVNTLLETVRQSQVKDVESLVVHLLEKENQKQIKINELETSIGALSGDESSLKQQLASVQLTLNAKEDEISRLQTQNNALAGEVETLKTEQVLLEKKMSSETEANKQLKEEFDSQRIIIAAKESEIVNLQSRITELDSQLSILKNQKADLETQVAEQLEAVTSLKSQVTELEEQLETLKAAKKEVETQLLEETERVSALKVTEANASQQIESLQAEIEKQREQVVSLTSELEIYSNKNSEEKSAIEKFKSELEQQLANKTSKINDLESQLTDYKGKYISLQNNYDIEVVAIARLRTEVQECRDDAAQWKEQSEKNQQEIDRLTSENKSLEQSCVEQLELLKAELEKTATEFKLLMEEYDTVKQQISEKDETITVLRSASDEVEEKFRTLNKENNHKAVELKKYREDFEELKSGMEELQAQTEELREFLSQKESELNQANQRLEQKEEQINLLKASSGEMSLLSDKIKEQQLEIEQHTSTIKSMEATMTTLNDTNRSAQEQFEAKLKEKEELIAAQENTWTQERREFEVRIEALSTEISTLKNQMEAAEQERKEALERELADKSKGENLLAQEISSLRAQLEEVASFKADLQLELDSKKERIADLEIQLDNLQSSVESLKQECTSSEKQVQEMQEEKQRLEQQKTSIESNLSIVTQEKVELEQERSRLELLLKEAEQQIQNQETEKSLNVATTAASVTVSTAAVATLEHFRETILEALYTASEVSTRMKTISYRVTQNRIHEITSSFDDATSETEEDVEDEESDSTLIDETKLSKFLITYKKLRHSVHALGVEIHELENQLTPKNEKSKTHDDDFSEEEEDLDGDDLKQQLKALQSKYDDAMEKMKLHTQERDRLLRQVVDLKKKAKKKSGSDSENEDQESDDDTAEEVARLANENKKLLKIKEELEERLDEMKEEHNEIVTLLKKNKTSLENEVKRLKESSVKSTSASPKLSPSADTQKIVDLERRIDELSEELEEAQGTIKAKEETIKKLKESISEVSEKNEELVDDLNNQITTWKEKCTDQYDHIQTIEKKLRKATEKNESEKIKSTDMTKQLQVFKQEQLEKYVLDSCILLINRPQFVKNLPISLKPIFLCILHWRCFDANKNVTFCPNLIRALDYVIDRNISKVRMEAYWINFLYRLLNLLSTDFNELVVKNLKEMQEQGDSTFFTNGSNESMKESIEKLRDTEMPSFVSSADASNSKSPSETADWFIKECCRLIIKAYTHLLRGIFAKMEKLVDKGVVSDLDSSSNPSLNQMKKILDKVLIQLEESKLEKRVVQHVLEHVAMYVDAYIFNSMMKQPNVNAGKALNIKMNVSTLANWFEDHGVRPSSLEEGAEENNMAQFTLFPYSRQVSDVCVIAQKTLLTDEGMRQIVCPTLTIAQIAHLMANYAPDEIDNKSVSADVLKTLQQIKDSQNEKLKSKVLYVKPAVRVQHYREPKSLAIQNQQPLFDFSKQGSLETSNNSIKDVQVSASLVEKYKEDLKFLNQ